MTAMAHIEALRHALGALHLAASEAELDANTHGPSIKKNKATIANHLNFNDAANRAKDLLRIARAAVEREPTDAHVRALLACEQDLQALIERFEPSFPAPPTYH